MTRRKMLSNLGPRHLGGLPFCVFVVAIVMICSSSATALTVAPGTKLWAVVSPDQGMRDAPDAMAVSPNGSKVFVVGWHDAGEGTQSGYETRAYDAATGREIWNRSFTGPESQGGASSVAADPDGSKVYVTGRTLNGSGAYDFTTVAYAARTGARLWVTREPVTAQGPPSVAADPEASRIYVTGAVRGSADAEPFYAMTIAYDPSDGSRIWRSRYLGAPESVDPSAIAVGPNGKRVYVTSELLRGNADYGTIAYAASTGDRVWVRTYDDPVHGWDIPIAVTVDPRGSRVYVTGIANASEPGTSDYATVAYKADGARLWAARYDGPAGSDDLTAPSLAVSPDGRRLFVTGNSTGLRTVGWATIAYATSSGTRLWTARYEGPAHAGAGAAGLALSPDGTRLYVTGDTTGSSGVSIVATRSYAAATGTPVWTSRYAGLGRGISARAIAVGPGGLRVFVSAMVVAGTFGDQEADWDFATVAYAA